MQRRLPARLPQVVTITVLSALLSAVSAADAARAAGMAQADSTGQASQPTTGPLETGGEPGSEETRSADLEPLPAAVEPGVEAEPEIQTFEFWPPMSGPALTWFAVVVILVLTLRPKPLLSERNLDGLVLAATCLLLALRLDRSVLPDWAAGKSVQWWSYLLLTVAGGYWLLRGLLCVAARGIPRAQCTVSRAALLILTLAGLAICVHRIATDPLSAGSRDGLVGGLFTVQTGKLPYGEAAQHDGRSPILYLLHAGAVTLVPPTYLPAGANVSVTMSWENRSGWMGTEWWRAGDFAPARLANALLFILLVIGVYLLGTRLDSPDIGLSMVAVLGVFPGAVECLSRPDIVLPTVLLAWSLVAATLPAVGGLLATLLIILAELAWPWAWLGLPVVLGYSFRSGWQACGSLVGLLAGAAGVMVGLTALTLPSLPRADGALHRAGLPPTYTVARGEDGVLRISREQAGEAAQTGLLRWFWKFLVTSENLVLDTMECGPHRSQVYAVDNIDPRTLLYRRIAPVGDARAELTDRYRAALAAEPIMTYAWVNLRTVLEQTWLSPQPPIEGIPGSWRLWSAASEEGGAWPAARKAAKVVALIIVLVTAVVLFRRKSARPAHLMGGLLVMSAAALLADYAGAVTNLIWLMPGVLAVWGASAAGTAAESQRPDAAERVAARLNPGFGPAPRISVER